MRGQGCGKESVEGTIYLSVREKCTTDTIEKGPQTPGKNFLFMEVVKQSLGDNFERESGSLWRIRLSGPESAF